MRLNTIHATLVISLALALLPRFAASSVTTGPGGLLIWDEPREVAEISFKDENGKPISLSDFTGKVVVLNIWATWCVPCREEMPTLDALQAELGGSRFEVLALSLDRNGVTVIEDFYQETGIQHLGIYVDESGLMGTRLKAVGIPTTILLNRHGQELGRLIGTTDWDNEDMVAFLADLIL